MEKKNLKIFLVFKKISFEPGSTSSHNPERDTCHWQSICYEATLRVNISLREIFSKPSFITVIKKQDESGLMNILQEFRTV